MTREEILKMGAGPELNTLVAEKVMRWKHISTRTPYRTVRDDGGCIMGGVPQIFSVGLIPETWRPSLEISDAWAVVEKLRKMDFCCIDVYSDHYYAWECRMRRLEDSHKGPWRINSFSCDTAPLAICRAALLAVI